MRFGGANFLLVLTCVGGYACADDSEGHDGMTAGTGSAAALSGAGTGGTGGGDDPFTDVARLDCQALALAWYDALEAVATDRRACEADEECAVVSTNVTCSTASGTSVSGCGASVATQSRGEYEQDLERLTVLFCNADGLPSCTVSSVCPDQLAARCIDGRCQAQ